ncbi:uncharacterized protein GGS25DRAFT_205635 [Hypoxylon fragiforme]|uniref:uncharacterized protein n=1 Tax=Hypoxylon fragiforme TaxID=63214 RepID=UPI0020C5CB2C|nr:uncharacterized protein GGS25DRAFT_205635 [Hypoxylon fragiforme]KAI2611689.1 hypothetical protein GGS25DRAFT_205635 [Hypoxylon fragiforme]
MQFKSTVFSTLALLMASTAIGAAIETPGHEVDARAAMIATDPYYACNCPNNCKHKQGSSCKYYSGPSDKSGQISGTCNSRDGSLTCVA